MGNSPPTNLSSLDARLRNHCAAAGQDYSRARRHIGTIIVAQMLGRSGTVVKGGRNLEIRYGLNTTRASTDLDVVRRASLDDLLEALDDALAIGSAGFTGGLAKERTINAPTPDGYLPHRVHVKLDFKGKPFGTVLLEIAVEEAGGLQHIDEIASADATRIFAAIGLPAPASMQVMSLPVQMAQKLHACTTPDTTEWVNDRAHDLIDLQIIRSDLPDERLHEVKEAAERLFASRKRHTWGELEVTARPGWAARYAEERKSVNDDVLDSVDAAITWANQLVAEIKQA